MSLHLCPIEPDDWSNGPSGGDEDCDVCGGSGVRMVNGVLPIPCECTEGRYDYFEDDVL